MNWIIVACILIFSSSGLYLTLRSIGKYKTSLELRSLTMFASPIIPLYTYSVYKNIPLKIEFQYVVMLLVSAIFLSWVAKIASLKALDNAPNPGYPLIIGKSYVVYTTIFATLFLGDELSFFKLCIIACILFFVSLVSFSSNTAFIQTGNKKWLYYAVFTFILFQQSGVYGYSVAPNPGYINAANVASIGVTTLFASYIFGDHLNTRTLIGVGGIIVCLFFLFL